MKTVKKSDRSAQRGVNLSVIIGPTVLEYSDTVELLDAIFELAKRKNTNFMPFTMAPMCGALLNSAPSGSCFPEGSHPKARGFLWLI